MVILIFIPFTQEIQKFFDVYKHNVPYAYKWPEIQDLCFSGVTAVSLLIIEKIVEEIFLPCFYDICKEKRD